MFASVVARLYDWLCLPRQTSLTSRATLTNKSSMSEQTTVTPAKAAELVGVEVYTIRRWCDWHAPSLSPGASPGPGALRRLTMRDIEVLKTVRDLRAQGLTTNTINEQLAGLTFAEIEPAPVDAAPMVATQAPQDSPGAPAPLAVVEALQSIQAQIQALQQARSDDKQAQRAAWWYIVFGIMIGLGLAAVFELAAIVATRGR